MVSETVVTLRVKPSMRLDFLISVYLPPPADELGAITVQHSLGEGGWRRELSGDEVIHLNMLLESLEVNWYTPSGDIINDGTTFELSVEAFTFKLRLDWGPEVPKGLKGVSALIDELTRIADSAPKTAPSPDSWEPFKAES